MMGVLGSSWFLWAVGIVVGLPLALIALTEWQQSLRRRGSNLIGPISLLRNVVVPLGALLMAMVGAIGMSAHSTPVRIVGTLIAIGILMLAVLGVLGFGDIHRLNAVKNVLATAINGTAAALFAAGSFLGSHDVSWGHAAIMAVAAVLGSFAGASVVRRLPAPFVRRCVALIGFALAAYYFRPS
jgi:uncharacterized membrane protein YfcA